MDNVIPILSTNHDYAAYLHDQQVFESFMKAFQMQQALRESSLKDIRQEA